MGDHLGSIDNDVLVYIFSYLSPPDILFMRQTCKRILEVSKLRIVWTNACKNHVLAKGYPFPDTPLERMQVSELERGVRHAYRLAKDWLAGKCTPKTTTFIDATDSTSVSDVRFVPGHGQLILTISKSIWSAVTIWNVMTNPPKKCCEWSPRGAIFSGFCLNSDPFSEATVAVSMLKDGRHTVEILELRIEDDEDAFLHPIYTVETNFRPTALKGDLIAVSDEISQTAIWNWKQGTYAILEQKQEKDLMWKTDHCIQVIFAHESILVVRARSVNLFPEPILRDRKESPQYYEPIVRHSFGWVDGVSAAICPTIVPCHLDPHASYAPLAILVRAESDDPWSSDLHDVELYSCPPNPHFISSEESDEDDTTSSSPSSPTISPYVFPPIKINQVHSLRGSLRCTDMILGKYGTAVWIQPKERAISGLLWADEVYHGTPSVNAHECLVATVFPGSLNLGTTGPGQGDKDKCCCTNVTKGYKICFNDLNNWTSLDYCENSGKIVLGSSFGKVMILEL